MGCITWGLYNISIKGNIYYEKETGLPFTYKSIRKKVYIPTNDDIPVKESIWFESEEEDTSMEKISLPILSERFRQFARMDGNYLWPYFKNVEGKSGIAYRAPVHLILEYFPTWETVEKSDEWKKHGPNNDWDETKHNLFKECLEWCNKQGGFCGEWPW
jgi:hypothetical protein